MGLLDWLLYTIRVSRRLTNGYYIIMLIITVIAVVLLYKMRYKRFSLNLWLISGLICLFWETYLFSTGARNYNFPVLLELPYHAFTEAGPGLIIMILFAHKIKLIDISEYSDDYKVSIKQVSKQRSKKGKTKKPRLKPEPGLTFENEDSKSATDSTEEDLEE